MKRWRILPLLLAGLLLASFAGALAEGAELSVSFGKSIPKKPYEYQYVSYSRTDNTYTVTWKCTGAEPQGYTVRLCSEDGKELESGSFDPETKEWEIPAEEYLTGHYTVQAEALLEDGSVLSSEPVLFTLKMSWWEDLVADFYLNFIQANRWTYLTDGLGRTMIITLAATLLGIVIGVILAMVRSTYDKTEANARPSFGRALFTIADRFCRLYLTVFRGTPVVVQLMIIYFVIFASSDNGVAVASLAFGLNSGAYVAEIVRGGIMSIDNGQFEAGRSLGFNYVQTMRFIVIPQTIKNVLPSLANEFIALLKETSVAGYVAVVDLTKGGDIIRSRTYSPFLPLLAVAAIYLILVIFFSRLVSILERRLRNSDH